MENKDYNGVFGGGNLLKVDFRGFEVKYKVAFTLAEVLITLGIIGVVAAMTIPGLMNASKAHRLRSQFLKSYSTIQQTFRQMEAEDCSLDPATYSTDAFYDEFKKRVKYVVDCGTNRRGMSSHGGLCYMKNSPTAYKTLDGKQKAYTEDFDDGQIVLLDGTVLLFENPSANRVWVHVDLNGFKNPPNRWGYDLFTFQLLDGELRTMGSIGTTYPDVATHCNYDASNNRNGVACAHRAKNETDYFKWVVKNVK